MLTALSSSRAVGGFIERGSASMTRAHATTHDPCRRLIEETTVPRRWVSMSSGSVSRHRVTGQVLKRITLSANTIRDTTSSSALYEEVDGGEVDSAFRPRGEDASAPKCAAISPTNDCVVGVGSSSPEGGRTSPTRRANWRKQAVEQK